MSRSGTPCCSTLSQRWIFAVMASLGSVNVFTMKSCLSLAITEMVATTGMESNATSSKAAYPVIAESTSAKSNSAKTYEWNEYTQGLILSSFYWGFVISQIPSAHLVNKFGGKYIYGLGIFSSSIFTLLTPTVVKAYDATGLIFLRVLMGLGEAGVSPASYDLIARWAPPSERSKITAVVMGGMQVGTILGSALSGVLIEYSSMGWPMAFYVFGAIGVLWFFAWIMLCYNNPDEHPFISQEEKTYLYETMKEHTHRETQPIPWQHMFTSVPLWAFLAAKIGQEWSFQMMIIDLPKYMSNVLKFSVEANGFLVALPNIAMWLFSIVSSWVADWLIETNKTSRTNVRKIFVTISTLGPAFLMIAASYAATDYGIVVVLFTSSMGVMGASHSGIFVNAIDLSPNYSVTLISVTNVIASLCGLMVPYTVGILTPNQTLLEWRTVFWISFVILCVANLIFNTWADAEVQYWNDPHSMVAKENGRERAHRLPFLKNSTGSEGRV